MGNQFLKTAVSLYSGGGGLDIGFHSAGFKTVFATDSEPTACETLRANNLADQIYEGPIEDIEDRVFSDIVKSYPGGIDVLIGGPPCPAYSKSRFYLKDKPQGKNDPSFSTVEHYFRVLGIIRPKFFIMENVQTFAAKRQQGALEYVLESSSKLGYEFEWRILNAVNYGVPQKRERFFLVGHLPGYKFKFPAPSNRTPQDSDLFNQHLPLWKTAGDVLSDIDDPSNDKVLPGHFAGGKDHGLLCKIPPGDNYLFFTEKRGHAAPVFQWRSRYWSFLLKLSPDLPSWTIQAKRSNNMGPFHWRNRILTVNEVARLQTFPDSVSIAGTITQQWRQIGNAVPPQLAERIAQSIVNSLENKTNE
jgi:DNA (cytosine-5)-methyltransferase 1